MDGAIAAATLLLAFALDRWFGEPPGRVHPVVGMGRYLGWMGERIAPAAGPRTALDAADWRRFARGTLAWCAGAAAVLALAVACERALALAPAWLAVCAGALLLKPLFAWRMLREETAAVERALAVSLDAGRARLAHLVSRDVQALDAGAVRESAIESLAENLNDSVVAPVFWFVVAGLPGAALYRFANTADAMWGYPGPRGGRDWAWAGKFAARADDVLSWAPARLTAGLLVLAAGPRAGRDLRTEARRTPSPNSGWPMAAMALALGVRLAKPGVYALNAGARVPDAAHAQRAQALAARAVGLALAAAVLVRGFAT